MDVRLSTEQVALRDTAARVVDQLGPRTVADIDDEDRRARLDTAVTHSGWRDLRMPDEGGRPLASGVEVALVAAELGRGLADVPLVGPLLAGDLKRRAGAPWDETSSSVALDPGLAGFAVMAGDGTDQPRRGLAFDATAASTALVCRSLNGKHDLVAVSVDDMSRDTDLTRSVGSVDLHAEGQLLDDQHPLSDEDFVAATAFGLMVTCADLVGVMKGANALTIEYATQRHQYGVAIGSFQAVQHQLADAHVATEGAASATLYAAWAVDALEPAEALAAAAVAKSWSARAAMSVCETAIQVHAGMGNTWECLAHVFLRRALLSIDTFGGVGPNLDRVLAHHGVGAPEAVEEGGHGLR